MKVITDSDFVERLERQKEDYSHSMTEENETFVSGVLYGLSLAEGIAKGMPASSKGEE